MSLVLFSENEYILSDNQVYIPAIKRYLTIKIYVISASMSLSRMFYQFPKRHLSPSNYRVYKLPYRAAFELQLIVQSKAGNWEMNLFGNGRVCSSLSIPRTLS